MTETPPTPKLPSLPATQAVELCVRCRLPRPARVDCRLCGRGDRVQKKPFLGIFQVVHGFTDYLNASLDCLTHREYMGRIFWAVFWNCILWIVASLVGVYFIYAGIASWTGETSSWFSQLAVVTGGLLALLVTLVVAFFLFPVLFSLFLFPFLDPLSRQAETEQLGWEVPASSRGFWGDFWDSIDTGARILGLQILAFLLTLPLLLSVIGFPVVLIIGAFLIGFCWLDYPLTRRGYNYSQKWKIAKRNWILLIGYGLAFELGLLVPFFGVFFSCPAAAIGSARLFYRLDLPPA